MTNAEMKSPQEIENEQMQQIQINAVKKSLIQSVFKLYYELINFLKSLPIHQNFPGILRAYGYIDDGMLWVKESIENSPIIFNQPTAPVPTEKNKEEQIDVPEEKPLEQVVESPEQSS